MRTVAIVQARMGSTRLPGKVLLPLTPGQTLLDAVLDCLRQAGALLAERAVSSAADALLADVVVAATTRPEDDAIAEHCRTRQTALFRGEAENVLERFVQAAEAFEADAVLRVCADNPLLDPHLIRCLVQFAEQRRPDYAGYRTAVGTPAICTPAGLTAEWVATDALRRLVRSAPTSEMAEHVTLGVYSQSGYDTAWLPLPEWADCSWLRLTCDTADDLDRLRYIFTSGPVHSSREELIAWIADQPGLVQAMRQANQANPKPLVSIPDRGRNSKGIPTR